MDNQQASGRPKFVVFALPRVVEDAGQMEALERGLVASFPELEIILAADNPFPGNQSAVAALKGHELAESDETRLMREIQEAMSYLIRPAKH